MDNDTILLQKLDKWNSDLARGLILNNVILSLYIIIGLLGNSIVILIYGFKMKGNKEERYFIPFLAIADLWASLVCASFGIAYNMMQAKFNNNDLCKAVWFFATFTTSFSIFLLFIIAVQRYLKICRPLGKQMTLKWKRFAMCLGIVIAFVLSTPMTYFYGLVSFTNEKEGIVGHRCSRLKSTNKAGSLIFGGIIVLIIISLIVCLIWFYTRIGYTIIILTMYNKKSKKQNIISSSEKPIQNSQLPNPPSLEHPCKTETGVHSVETDNNNLSCVAKSTIPTELNNRVGLKDSKATRAKPSTFKSSARRRKEQTNKRIVHKFTLMFMMITVIFLICYIPKVIIMLLEAGNPRFWEELSDSGRAGMLFVYRMFIINNITNPFIYAFLDTQFSREIRKVLKVCR